MGGRKPRWSTGLLRSARRGLLYPEEPVRASTSGFWPVTVQDGAFPLRHGSGAGLPALFVTLIARVGSVHAGPNEWLVPVRFFERRAKQSTSGRAVSLARRSSRVTTRPGRLWGLPAPRASAPLMAGTLADPAQVSGLGLRLTLLLWMEGLRPRRRRIAFYSYVFRKNGVGASLSPLASAHGELDTQTVARLCLKLGPPATVSTSLLRFLDGSSFGTINSSGYQHTLNRACRKQITISSQSWQPVIRVTGSSILPEFNN